MRRNYGLSKVLITADPATREWCQAVELARGLREHGIRTTMALDGRPTAEQAERACAIPDLNLRIANEGDPSLDWMLFLEGRVEPDLVHMFVPEHGRLAWRSHTVLTHHGRLEGAEDAQRAVLCSQDLVVFSSGEATKEFTQRYGCMNNAITIYPGLHAEEYRWTQNKSMVLASADSEHMPMLHQVAPQLEWPLYVLGTLTSADVKHNMVSAGHVQDTARKAWFGRSPVFLHCGTDDPFPIDVLEAALSNCALILPDTPSLREVWDRSAVFFNPNDPVTLTSVLGQVLEDEGLRHYYRIRARERGSSYSSKAMARSYLFAYQETLQESGLDVAQINVH